MNTSVSVIIPTFNRWHVLPRAVDSALAQTTAANEIIVVDDGSTDDTGKMLHRAYGNRVKYLHQSNAGVSAARNNGIQTACSDWIALLDSDDEWLPEKLQRQINAIASVQDCVLNHTDEIWVRNGVRVNPMEKHRKSGGDIFAQCLPLCAISPSSVLIKKDLFNAVGMFDESLPACEDYDLWLRICSTHKVQYLDDKLLVKYGGHEDQLSKKYWGMDRFRIKALEKLLLNSELTIEQTKLATDMLQRKIHILYKGAVKHSNRQLAEECLESISRFDLRLPESG